MPPFILKGATLGEKHRNFNLQVEEAVTNNASFEEIKARSANSDIDYLFAIEIASKYKNDDFILEALKSEDMLYASTAIKKSTWLINDVRYCHIVNPENLHTQLFPQMTTKAIGKFLRHIRLVLKDEARVDEFFKFYEEIDIRTAIKWLPNCSLRLIDETVQKHSNKLSVRLFKKLCERSFSVFEKFYKEACLKVPYLKAVSHFLNDAEYVEKYLKIVEPLFFFDYIMFNRRESVAILKHCPQRVIDNFEEYVKAIHLETLGKHLGRNNLNTFVMEQAKNKKLKDFLQYKNIDKLTKAIPKEDTYEIMKDLFSSQNILDESIHLKNLYQSYRYAPFDVAFKELKKKLEDDVVSNDNKFMILETLLTTASSQNESLETLLQYYHDNHMNDSIKYKMKFMNCIVYNTNIHKFDEKCWNSLNQIFNTMEIYVEPGNKYSNCIEGIIIYKTFNKQPVPDVIINKFKFNTMLKVKSMMKSDVESNVIFNFLYNFLEEKLKNLSVTDKESFTDIVGLLDSMLDLLNDWNKDLKNYPFVLNKIKEIIKLKLKEWNVSLELLYNKNKSWKIYMFEESLMLSHKDEVFVNALKHDPKIFERHLDQINDIRNDNKVTLWRFLSKIKIYWTESLAKDWANAYLNKIEQPNDPRILIRGLCEVLPQNELLQLINKFAPDKTDTASNNQDDHTSKLRENIAKLMHHSRPHPPPELVLLYVQGDYFKHSSPSVNAVFRNLSANKFPDYIDHLTADPDILQHYGLELIYSKMNLKELHKVVTKIWRNSKNSKIRTIIFRQTFQFLCKQKETLKIKKVWSLFEPFINDLSEKEVIATYALFGEIDKVPQAVRADFCMAGYNFLNSLPPKSYINKMCQTITLRCEKLMDSLDPDFVANVILNVIDRWYIQKNVSSPSYYDTHHFPDVIAAYLLRTADDNVQMQRYEKVFQPIVNNSLTMWSMNLNESTPIRQQFMYIVWVLLTMSRDHFVRNIYAVPIKLFSRLVDDVQPQISAITNYDTVIICKLGLLYVKSFATIKKELPDAEDLDSKEFIAKDKRIQERYKEMWQKIAPVFADLCLSLIEEDMHKYFPSIHKVIGKKLSSFNAIMTAVAPYEDLELPKAFLKNNEDVISYLTALEVTPYRFMNEEKEKQLETLLDLYKTHPSDEVKLHYYDKYCDREAKL